jgi:hypothetical protein
MIIPDKAEVINRIETNLPKEIINDNIWIAYYFKQQENGKVTKPPCANKGYTVDGHGVSFEKACEDGYPGILITKDSPYIAFDIDDLQAKMHKRAFSFDLLSREFQDFLLTYPTYIEYSPSKCGLRILAKCHDKKTLLTRPGWSKLSNEKCIGGELFLHRGYVTITGDVLKNSRSLLTIPDSHLLGWAVAKTVDEKNPTKKETDSFGIHNINAIKECLSLCKLDQSNVVKKAYLNLFQQEYGHYDYWLKILQALHDYATKSGKVSETLQLAIDWSREDAASFQSENDIITKWDSFGRTENTITYKTLLKLAQLLRFQWPKPAYDKKGNPTGGPAVNENENFKYLINKLGIEFYRDDFSQEYYVKVDDKLKSKYFQGDIDTFEFFDLIGPFEDKTLSSRMWEISQDYGYTNVVKNTIEALFFAYFKKSLKRFNFMEMWLSVPGDQLPYNLREPNTDINKSNLNYLLSLIPIASTHNPELIRKYFETFFFEMTMPIYNPLRKFSGRSFALILSGRGGTHKTTFFQMLFPQFLSRILMTSQTEKLKSDKSKRDMERALTSHALVCVDEFDMFYDPNDDALFKNLVTTDRPDFTEIYAKKTSKPNRQAVLAGTTNKEYIPFSPDCNRQFALIKITDPIDTSGMELINWHHFYRHYVALGRKNLSTKPWQFTQEDYATQYKDNEFFRASSNLEQSLRAVFDFDCTLKHHKEPYDFNTISSAQTDKRLIKVKDIRAALVQYNPSGHASFTEAAIKNQIEYLCGKYTNTLIDPKPLKLCKGQIYKGKVFVDKRPCGYLMPPKFTEFTDILN